MEMEKNIINNRSLSFKAKGLWMYLKDKPTGWRFSVARITSQTADGRDAIKSGLKELEQAGLLKRTKMKNSKGEFCGICYELRGGETIVPLDILEEKDI